MCKLSLKDKNKEKIYTNLIKRVSIELEKYKKVRENYEESRVQFQNGIKGKINFKNQNNLNDSSIKHDDDIPIKIVYDQEEWAIKRGQNIDEMNRQAHQVNELSKLLVKGIKEQDEMIDKIVQDTKVATNHTTNGANNVQEAEEMQKRSCLDMSFWLNLLKLFKWYCIMICTIVLLGAIGIVVFLIK